MNNLIMKREKFLQRPMVKVDSQGKILKVYRTNTSLVVDGLKYINVYKCCKGYMKKHKGFRFFFLDEYKEERPEYDGFKVLCLDAYGNVIKTYDRIKDTIYDGFWDSSVSQCVNLTNTKTRHHKGYFWCYKKDYDMVLKDIEKNFVLQYQDDKLINIYANMKEVKEQGYDGSSVYQCLNSKANTHAGCVWRRNY